MLDMARKLHSRKDTEIDNKSRDDISWIKEMMQKPHLVSIKLHFISSPGLSHALSKLINFVFIF